VHALVSLPSLWDIGGLVSYVIDHPHLFISSSTVITTCLVLATMTVGAVGTFARVIPTPFAGARQWIEALLRWLAPKLALVLVYFGLGSMTLATQIILRFHHVIPVETELQFRSGLGHLAVAAIGIAILVPLLRGRAPREWTVANFWALAYWTFHVLVLTPPWFFFQGQGELVLTVARSALAAGFALNFALWCRTRQGESANADHAAA
jgi:hypothetical protein